VAEFFRNADAVALPYRRSSSSGPLHIAMSCGLPVLVSDVGGLREAAEKYEGVVFTKPTDPRDIARGLEELSGLTGRTYRDPHSWTNTREAYERLFRSIGVSGWTRSEHVVDPDVARTGHESRVVDRGRGEWTCQA
jgi:glycosyltransferase involved in cell wall biosynthesis